MAMEIFAGSNGTTEPLRRITLYWSNGILLEETEGSETSWTDTEEEDKTLSVASNIKLPFYIQKTGFAYNGRPAQKTKKPLHVVVRPLIFANSSAYLILCKENFGLDNLILLTQ
jgi:hypothetical protein